MNISRSILLIACLTCFLVGAGVTWIVQSGSRQEVTVPELDTRYPQFDDEFMDDFFSRPFFDHSRDPFSEMERMRNRIDEELRDLQRPQQGSLFGNRFDRWFGDRFGNRSAGNITMREDDDYIYYELNLGDEVDGETDVTVEDGVITISGRTEARTESSRGGTSVESRSAATFLQKFPLPPGTDPASVHVEDADGTVTIRIGKAGRN